MTLHQFLAVLRARWRIALGLFLATVAAAALTTLFLPRTWTASASLLIDTSRPDPVTGLSNGGNPSPAILSTQLGVLRSDRVALDVVRGLRLADDPRTRAAWTAATQGKGEIEAWVASELLKHTDVTPERDSNVVTVSVQAATPERAAELANAFASSYLDVSAAVRAEAARAASSFFVKRAAELRAALEQAQARLTAFQRAKGVVVADDRLDSEVTHMNELSAQLTLAQAAAAGSVGRHALAQGGATDELPEAQSDPVLASLRAELTRAEAESQSLNARLGENHPQVRQARATIALLRGRIDAETRRVSGAVGLVTAAQQRQTGELQAALDAQRARVVRMKAVQGDGQVLLHDVENAQRAYDAVQARLSQASLESHALQGNAVLLAPAMPPTTPSSTRRLVAVGMAAAIGLLLGLGAAILLEFADPRLRTLDAVVSVLDQPVIGVLPRPGTAGPFLARKVPLVGHGSARTPPRLEPPSSSARHAHRSA